MSCQTNTKPCSSNPCLNAGNCSDIILNSTNNWFSCECKNNYFGVFCENRINICDNTTCNGQGYCFINSTTNNASCKCFPYYSGEKCEISSTYMKYRKVVITLATILAIITIIAFIVFILSMDYFKYFLMNPNPLKKSKTKIKIRRFKYHHFVEKIDDPKFHNLNDNINQTQYNAIAIVNNENVLTTEAENAFDVKIEI